MKRLMFEFIARKINAYMLSRELKLLMEQVTLVEKSINHHKECAAYYATVLALKEQGLVVNIAQAVLDDFAATHAHREAQLVIAIKALSTKVDILLNLKAELAA